MLQILFSLWEKVLLSIDRYLNSVFQRMQCMFCIQIYAYSVSVEDWLENWHNQQGSQRELYQKTYVFDIEMLRVVFYVLMNNAGNLW